MKLEQQTLFHLADDERVDYDVEPPKPKRRNTGRLVEELKREVSYWKREAKQAREDRDAAWARVEQVLEAEHLLIQLNNYLNQLDQ